MTTSALYFPYIEVPDGAWTTRAVLYWDRLTSIVPMDHRESETLMGPRMRELMAAGLVVPVVPGLVLRKSAKFGSAFVDAVRAHRPVARGEVFSTTRIHAEKLNEVSDFLVEEGLAKWLPDGWFEVETTTANQFMAYLAVVLGALPEVDAAPVTDNFRCAKALGYLPKSAHQMMAPRQAARDRLLRHVLPIPDRVPPVIEIVRFKEKHGDLLPALRAKIEDHCTVISSMPGPEAQLAASRLAVAEINERTDEIAAAMKVSFGNIIFSGFTAISGVALSLAGGLNALGIAGAAVSLADPAKQAISSIRGTKSDAARRPLAYLAHARRAFSALR